jgi:lactoylglutathione lyase
LLLVEPAEPDSTRVAKGLRPEATTERTDVVSALALAEVTGRRHEVAMMGAEPGSGADQRTVNHVGLCVTDLATARAFYEEALGFTFERELRPPDDLTGRLLGVEAPVQLTAVYLTMGEFVLELLQYERAGNPPFRARAMNEPGLTHLSLTVPDLAGTLARVRTWGGSLVESSDVGVTIMVRDPDGQLIELLAAPRDGGRSGG